MKQVVVAEIELDMSDYINSEGEAQIINSFKLESGYKNVDLEIEWTITKSDHQKTPHNHEHKIDLEEEDTAGLERVSTLRNSI